VVCDLNSGCRDRRPWASFHATVHGIRRVRALKVFAATAVTSLAFASSADACHGNTWLDWAYLSANYATQSGYTHTNQAATRPLTNRWGCAELKQSKGHYVFSSWYCGTIHEQGSALASPCMCEQVVDDHGLPSLRDEVGLRRR
jgi:hypothetical protein